MQSQFSNDKRSIKNDVLELFEFPFFLSGQEEKSKRWQKVMLVMDHEEIVKMPKLPSSIHGIQVFSYF